MAEQLGSSSGPRARHLEPHLPSFVPIFNPIALRLMRLGVPLGPNALISVRGRKSGVQRTTPVALVEVKGGRWIIGTFGDVNWVRNLRASGEGTLTIGRRAERVRAVELDRSEAADFFAHVLKPYVERHWIGRWVLGSVLGAREILDDPEGAAGKRPVFALHPAA